MKSKFDIIELHVLVYEDITASKHLIIVRNGVNV